MNGSAHLSGPRTMATVISFVKAFAYRTFYRVMRKYYRRCIFRWPVIKHKLFFIQAKNKARGLFL